MGIMFDQLNHFASYFVTSIPKVKSPSHLGEFRPISLVESMYNLLAKVLPLDLGML